jgi:hypothetical protein
MNMPLRTSRKSIEKLLKLNILMFPISVFLKHLPQLRLKWESINFRASLVLVNSVSDPINDILGRHYKRPRYMEAAQHNVSLVAI